MPKIFSWGITRLIQILKNVYSSSQEQVGEVRRKQFLHVPVTDQFAIPQNLIYINSHYVASHRS